MKVGTDGVLLGAWADVGGASRILDIGTGTGLIALMLAQRNAEAAIEAVEIEEGAYKQANENIQVSPWKKRISVHLSSFQEYSNQELRIFDLIVSNPPFFVDSLKSPLDGRTLARHNDTLPHSVLIAGVNNLLSLEGKFCLILPYVDSQLFVVDAAMEGLFCNKKVNVHPTPQKKANRVLMQFSRNRTKLEETELLIRDNTSDYSEEYKKLTKEFYLFF